MTDRHEMLVRRVLVVEDNPANQFVVLKQLTALGFVGSAVASGHEAIEAVKHEAFGLILMDCCLPDMDGYETTRVIRRFEEGADQARVPIVAVTAETGSEALAKCICAGMDAYMPKPSNIVALRDALTRFIA